MLVKLTPEQVAAHWGDFRSGVRDSLPPQVAVSNEAVKNVLKNLLDGRGTVWLYTDYDKIYGFVITTQHRDPLAETGALLIYCAYSFGGVTSEMISDALETLEQHAKDNGLEEMIAFSANEQLARYAEMQGASVNYRLINFEI